MKYLVLTVLLFLVSSCQTHYDSYVGTYIFGKWGEFPSRANTVTGSLEVLTTKGWVKVEEIPSQPPLYNDTNVR